jgi:hypothetical protein
MEKRGKVRKSEVGRIELYTEWLSLAKGSQLSPDIGRVGFSVRDGDSYV